MRRRRTCIAALLVFSYCLPNICGAGNITCTVTQGTDRTTYRVPDKGKSGCTNSWSNASDTDHNVLAHEDGWNEDGPVRSANVSTLITSECFPLVIYKRHCAFEDEEDTSTCNISCSEQIVPQKEDAVAVIKTTSRSRIIAFLITSIVSIAIIVGLIYYKSKKTCCYTLVNVKDVEAQATLRQ